MQTHPAVVWCSTWLVVFLAAGLFGGCSQTDHPKVIDDTLVAEFGTIDITTGSAIVEKDVVVEWPKDRPRSIVEVFQSCACLSVLIDGKKLVQDEAIEIGDTFTLTLAVQPKAVGPYDEGVKLLFANGEMLTVVAKGTVTRAGTITVVPLSRQSGALRVRVVVSSERELGLINESIVVDSNADLQVEQTAPDWVLLEGGDTATGRHWKYTAVVNVLRKSVAEQSGSKAVHATVRVGGIADKVVLYF